jgi:hypothetical protein
MPQSLHSLHLGPFNLIRCRLTHLRCRRPIVLTCEEVDWAFLGVYLGNAVAGIEAAEVEVEVAVEDAVGLGGVEVPD